MAKSVAALLRLAWPSYLLILFFQLIVGALMVMARIGRLYLPCGSLLGCATAIHQSPAVLGMHLTDYALLFAILCLGAAAFALTTKVGQPKRLLTPLHIIGFAGSFGANAYNYVVNDEVCLYCLSFATLTLLSLGLLMLAQTKTFHELTREATTVITLAGIVASALFLGLRRELLLSVRSGTIYGIPISDVLGSQGFFFGDRRSQRQMVVFYSPSCQACKDEISMLWLTVERGAPLGVTLRAAPPEADLTARQLAETLETLAISGRTKSALGLLAMGTEGQIAELRTLPVSPEAATAVNQDMRAAKALDIKGTPVCVLISGNGASFVPNGDLPDLVLQTPTRQRPP